ncbi:MAG: type VI secretion system baseplate subunit TssF, partial [Phaeodactylibacter sp.]|nr:type VI secretion system baseplate subunit TssF [Phaeodactylibacter sp.]
MQTFEMIRSRLLQNAAGRFHRQPEELIPETRLFIDWMAWEVGSLYRELNRSSDNISRNILRRITPDISIRPLPAHAIAQALPRQASYNLNPEEDLFSMPRLGGQAPHQLFFSPLLAVPLVQAKVKYLAAGREVESQAAIPAGTAFHPGMLWLGIRFEERTAMQPQLRIYLDRKEE